MYFLYLNKHSTCLHTQIHTFTHNTRKVYVIKTTECIIRKRGKGKAKKGECYWIIWLLCGTGWEWVMYLITCTHVLLFPVHMNTISDIWRLLFDRHQKVQRTPIESCHDHDMLTLHIHTCSFTYFFQKIMSRILVIQSIESWNFL